MSPAGQRLWSLIADAHRRVRRDTALAVAGMAAAVVPTIFVVAWFAGGRGSWRAPSPGPLLLEIIGLAAIGGVAFWASRRWLAGLTETRIAAAAESSRGLPDGSVRGVLELGRALPPGASPALVFRAETELARTLAGATPAELAGELGEKAARFRTRVLIGLAGLTVGTLALGFASPERTRAGWAPLLNPLAHMTPPPMAPLVVEPGDAQVTRGSGLDVHIQAIGRNSVTVRWRSQGQVPGQREVAVTQDRATTHLAGIDAPLQYWVTAPDGAVSDTFTVTPVDPLLVSELVVDVTFPEYLERPAERYSGDVPPLALPAGSTLDIRGRATRLLDRAELIHATLGVRVELPVVEDQFSARWTPRTSGVYRWGFAGADGMPAGSTPAPLELVVVPDSAPRVEIAYPGQDTILSPDMVQPLVVHARDDHGLASAFLVSWRASARGESGTPVSIPIAVEGSPQRVTLETLLDVTDQQLVPGDTIYYYVSATDRSPARQEGRSRTYALRVPGLDELRQRAESEVRAMLEEMDATAIVARQLEQALRDDRRRSAASSSSAAGSSVRPGATTRSDGGRAPLDNARAEAARQMLQQQESLVEQIEGMRARTDALERAMQSAGLQDPELQRRIDEMRQLFDEMLTPELRAQLDSLRTGVQRLDAEQVERALQSVAESQEQLRRLMEQNIELLKRAAAEQQLNALAQEARELAAQQDALAEAMRVEGEPTPQRIDQQRALEERARKLIEALGGLSERLNELGESAASQSSEQARERVAVAENAMGQAAAEAMQRDGQQAGELGAQAADELAEVARTLEETRTAMAGSWKEETRQAVQQAAMEAIELAERQQELLDRMREAGATPGGAPMIPQASGVQLPQPPELAMGRQSPNQQGDQSQDPSGQMNLPNPTSQSDQRDSSGQQGAQTQPGSQDQRDQVQQGQGQGSQGQQMGSQGMPQPGTGQSGQQGQQSQSGQGAQSGAGQQAGSGADQGRAGGQQGNAQSGGQTSRNAAGQYAQGQQGAGTGDGGGQDVGGQSGENVLESIRSEQVALDQSIEALGRNLAEMGQRSALVNREVSAALARSQMSSQQTLQAMTSQDTGSRMPIEEAQQTVDALNQLALALLEYEQQIAQAQSGTGMQEAMSELAELARQQGQLSGQSSALNSMGLTESMIQAQLAAMARQQQEIASKIEGVGNMVGNRDGLAGRLDELAREASAIARELSGGRLTAEITARQERLFHRLLDAGRTLERDEVSPERVAGRPGNVAPSLAAPLDPALLEAGPRYRVPDAAQLNRLPPAMRRLVIEYFDRLNEAERAGTDASP